MPYHVWNLATSEERVLFHEYAELIETLGGAIRSPSPKALMPSGSN